MSAGLLCRLRRSLAAVLLVGLAVPTFAQTTPVATLGGDSFVSLDEDVGTYNVVVNLSPAPASSITINYALNSLSTTDSDYTDPNSGSISVAANEASANIPVVIVDDNLEELNELFRVRLIAGSGYTLGGGNSIIVQDVIIQDNDRLNAIIDQSDGDTTVTEADGTDTYTFPLDRQPPGDVEIMVVSNATNVATVSPSILTFTTANWNMAQTVTVTGVNNNRDDAMNARTAIIQHAAMSTIEYDLDSVDVTVTDDDVPVLTVSEQDGHTTIVEGGDARTFVVVSDIPIDGLVSYRSPTSDDLSIVFITPPTLTGETPMHTSEISFGDDDMDDPSGRTATAVIRAGSGYTLGDPSTVTFTVIDNDPTTVTLAGVDGDIGEGDGKPFTVTLGRELVDGEVLAVPLTFMGEATPGTDYTVTGAAATGVAYTGLNSATGTVTFTGPSAASATLTLSATPDSDVEASGETVIIDLGTLDGDSGTGLDGGATGTDNLADFSIQPFSASITLTSTTGSEGNSGSQDTRFQINMAPARSRLTNFLVCIDPGSTAIYQGGGRDFILRTASRNSFIVGVGSTTQAQGTTTPGCTAVVVGANATNTGTTYNIRTDGDTTDEPDETVVLTLARVTASTSSVNTPNGVAISPTANRVTFTITDDDPTVVSLTRPSSDTGAVHEGAEAILVVDLSRRLINGETIDVPLSISGTNVTPDDWNLALSGTSFGATLSGEDTSTPLLRISDAASLGGANLFLTPTFDETDEGGTETYTIALGPDGAGTNGFDRTTLGTNVGGGADPHATTNTLDLEVLDSMRHTMSLSLDSEMGAEGDSGLSDGATMTMTIDPPSPQVVSFDIQLSGTATRGGNDYSVFVAGSNTDGSVSDSTLRLNLPANRATVPFRIRANGDTVDESNETVTLALVRFGTPANVIFDDDATTVTYTITDDDTAGVTITETDDATTLIEDGTDDYGVVLTSQPTADVTITPTSGTTATATVSPSALTFTATNWDTAQTFTVTGVDNAIDGADQEVTISHTATATGDAIYNAITPASVTATVIDDEPTIVSLTRTGGTGAIEEGGTVGFTIALDRALTAGEIIDVPLSIGGTGVTTDDWSLTAAGTGVTLSAEGTATPLLSFAGEGSETATLVLTTARDVTTEGTGTETYTIALGPNDNSANGFDHASRATNVGGGADPHPSDNTFDVMVGDVSLISFALASSAADEGVGTHNVVFNLMPAPTADMMITYVSTAHSATENGDYSVPGRRISVTANTSSVSIPVTIIDDSLDEIRESAALTLTTIGSDYTPGSTSTHTLFIIDNDATTVTLAGAAGDIMEGADKAFTVTLGRALAAGEALAVPLTFMGEATPGTDYTVTGATASGVTYSGLGSAAGTVTFTGPSAASTTLTLSATADSDVEASGESVIIGLGTLNSNSGTDLGGGASGTDNLADFNIGGPPPVIGITGGPAVTEGSAATFTVTASRAQATDLPIMLTVADAAAPGDYLDSGDEGARMVNLPGGTTMTTVQIATQADRIDEPNGLITATIADGTGYTVDTPPAATVQVRDDDMTAVALSSSTAGNITEGASKVFTVALTRPLIAGESLAVPLTFMGEATPGTDYTVTGPAAMGIAYSGLNSAAGTVTFTGPSADRTRLTLTATLDNEVEAAGETVDIDLGTLGRDSGTNLGGGAFDADILNIFTIEDPSILTITGGAAVTEGSSVTFTVTADRVPSSDLDITLTVADAAAGDYLDAGDEGERMVTLSGTTTATLEIPTQADAIDETNGLITMTIADGTGYTVGMPSSAMVGVSDDDATTVTLAGTAADINEGVTRNLTVTVNRPLAAGESLAVPLTLGGTATRGTDYTLTGTDADGIAYTIPDSGPAGTVTFTGPAPAIATLTLAVQTDDADDAGETITIAPGTPTGSGPGGPLGGALIGTGSLDYTIMQDPAIVLLPTLAITEGASANYAVSLAVLPTIDVTIAVTGQAGTELTLSPDALTFTATNWNTIQSFTVTAGTDADADDDTATLMHTATGGNYDTVTAQITVNTRDEDEAGVTLTETQDDTTVIEQGSADGGTDTYTVVLATQPASAVEITVTSDTTSAATVSPMTLTFTTANWNTAQTVTVTGINDNRVNAGGERTASLSHHISTGDSRSYPTNGLSPAPVTVTVSDDDEAGVTLTETQGGTTVVEDGSADGGTDTYTVELDTQPSADVVIVPTSGTTSAATVSPPRLTFTPANWEAVQTVTVTGADDSTDAVDRQSSITHAATSTDADYNDIMVDSVTATVRDDEPTVVSLMRTGTTGAVDEGGTVGFTITLGRALSAGEIIDVPLSIGGTNVTTADWSLAAAGSGVSLTNEATATPLLSFAEGAETATLELSPEADNIDEGTETYRIELGANGDGTNGFDHTSLGTNVGGGADPHGSANGFDVEVVDAASHIVSVAIDPAMGAEGDTGLSDGATVTVTVTPPRPQGFALSLELSGTATRGSDYRFTQADNSEITGALELSFAADQASVAYKIRVSGDAVDEDDETVIVTVDRVGTTPEDVAIAPGAASVSYTVLNDDTPPGVTLVEPNGATTLTETGSARYTMVLNRQPTSDVTVVATSGMASLATVSPAAGLIFSDSNWDTAQTVTVTGVNNDADASDRTVIISHAATSTDSNYSGLAVASVTATVSDDDATPVTLAGAAGNLTEGDAKTITVTLGRALVAGEVLAVPLSFGGAATPGTDYSITGRAASGVSYTGLNGAAGTVTFTGPLTGMTATVATLTLSATVDSVDEGGGETVDIDLGTLDGDSGTNLGGGASGTDSLADFTIEEPVVIDITGGAAVTEGSSATFTLTASRAPGAELSITVAVTDAAAGNFVDSGAEGEATVTLASGATTVTYEVATQADVTDEASGTLTVTVADGDGYMVGPSPVAMVAVNDDDATVVTLSGAGGNLNEGATSALSVTLNRGLISGESLAVPLTLGGTAERGTDYTLTGTPANNIAYDIPDSGGAGTVTFSGPSVSAATLTLRILTDIITDANETIDIDLGPLGTTTGTNLGGGARGTDNLADFVIMEEPTIVLMPASLTVTEGGSAVGYAVSLATRPMVNVAIAVTGHSGTDLSPTPSGLTFTSANWSAVQTITVTADTDVDAVDDTARLTHTASATGDGYDGVTAQLPVTITDPDMAGVTLVETAGATRIVENGSTDTYTVELSTQPSGNVELMIASSDQTAATVSPTGLTFTMGNWNTAQEVTVRGVDDRIDNAGGERRVSLSHRISRGDGNSYPTDGLTLESLAVTVVDDDEAGVRFSETGVTVNENGAEDGGTASYTVVLTTPPAGAVEIAVSSDLPTAATASPAVLTFTVGNWDTEQTVTVRGVDDRLDNSPRDRRRTRISHGIRVGDGVGYPTSLSLTAVVVAVLDDDAAPAVMISAMEDFTVNENGGMASYTVELASQPAGDVEITTTSTMPIAAMVSPASLTFTTANWDTAQRVTVTGVDDNINNPDNRRTASIGHRISNGDGGGYPTDGLSPESVVVTVTDDDAAPGVMISVDVATVNENGGTASYTVELASQPAGDVEITTTSTMPIAAMVSPASLTFTTVNWDTAQRVTVTGVDDNINNPGNRRTASIGHRISVGDGGGYPTDGLSPESVVVTVTDDDAAPGVTISVDVATVNENGGTASYTVVLDSQPGAPVQLTVTSDTPTAATAGPSTLTFTTVNWNTAQVVTVTGVVDDIDHPGGARTASIGHRISNGDGGRYPTDGLSPESVVVTVTDGETETSQMQAAQETWLPRFGLMALEHMLGGLDARFSLTDRAPGLSGNVSGLSSGRALPGVDHGIGDVSGLGADGFGQGAGHGDGLGAGSVDRLLNLSRTLSLRDMLSGSRFVYTDQDGVSVWGQASYSRYEDAREGVTVDGEVTTGLLGVDSDNGRTLLGLALSYSEGTGDWSGASAQGELSSTLASLLPYIRHNVTERLQLWAAASYGLGNLEQSSTSADSRHDINQLSASVGLRGTLLERPVEAGGLKLELTSDATLARIESNDDDGGVAGLTADTQRLRLGLEWSWQMPQADGGRLVPELELGMRYDGGDSSDGVGVELGGGISWELPSRGLTVDVRGRRLLDHDAAERREWGVSGSLRYELQPDTAYGPSLSVRQEYGTAAASGGLDRLLSDSLSEALEGDSSQPGSASGRWSLEGEWGLALSDGATGIPYAGLSSSGTSSGSGRDLTVGWRLLSAPGGPDTELDIKALRRRDGEGKTNHGIGAQWKLHW